MKKCRKCGARKPLEDFYKMKGMKDAYRNDCKACDLVAEHERYLRNPETEIARVKKRQQGNGERLNAYRRDHRQLESTKRRGRSSHLKRKFGLTLDQYDELLVQQGGVCAICEDPPEDGKAFHIDHDHETGEVRGLLCLRCNNGLGQFKEDSDLLKKAMVSVIDHEPGAAEMNALARRRIVELIAGR